MNKALEIAYKLEQWRDTAKMLLGDKYESRVGETKEAMTEYMALHKLELLPACAAILNEIANSKAPGIQGMLVAAATVELSESPVAAKEATK